MKKDYNKTKKLVIMGLAVVAVCLFVGVCIYLSKMGKPEPVEAEPTGNGDRDHRDKRTGDRCSRSNRRTACDRTDP